MSDLNPPSPQVEETTPLPSLTDNPIISGSVVVEHDIGQAKHGPRLDAVGLDATSGASKAVVTSSGVQGDREATDHGSATDAETNAAFSDVASDEDVEDDDVKRNEVEEDDAIMEVPIEDRVVPKFTSQPFAGFRPSQVDAARGEFDYDSESSEDDDDDGVEEEHDIVPYDPDEDEKEAEVEQDGQQSNPLPDTPEGTEATGQELQPVALRVEVPPLKPCLSSTDQRLSGTSAPRAAADLDATNAGSEDVDMEDTALAISLDVLFDFSVDAEMDQPVTSAMTGVLKPSDGPRSLKGEGKSVSFAPGPPVRKEPVSHGFVFHPDDLSDDDSLFVRQDPKVAAHSGGDDRSGESSGIFACRRRKPAVGISESEDDQLLSDDDLEQVGIGLGHEDILGDGSRSVEDMFAMMDEDQPVAQQLVSKSIAMNGGRYARPSGIGAFSRICAQQEQEKTDIVRGRGVPRPERVVNPTPVAGVLPMRSLFLMPKAPWFQLPAAMSGPSISSQSVEEPQRPTSIKDAQQAMMRKLLEKSCGSNVPTQSAPSVQPAKVPAPSKTVPREDHTWMEEEADEEVDQGASLRAEMQGLETKVNNGGRLSNREITRFCSLRGNLKKLETMREKMGGSSEATSSVKRLALEDNEDDKDEAEAARERSNYRRQQEAELRAEALRKSVPQPSTDVSVKKRTHGKTARERHEILTQRDAETSTGAVCNSASAIVKPGRKITKNRLASKWSQEDEVMQSIFKDLLTSDVVQQRAGQGDIEEAPVMETKIKAQQLNNLLSTIPADHNVCMAKKERAQLLEASKSFGHGKVKARDGHWHMKGMSETTLLRHHQLQAAAWMVGREVSDAKPHGGILADQMGLGKTIEAIACCIGNPPDKKDLSANRRTTLLVLPASLVGQWNKEIEKHSDLDLWGKIMVYKKSTKMSIRALREMNFVLTTYAEVRNSWKIEDSGTLTEEDIANQSILGKDEWLALNHDRCGPLHQMEWYRIILDEAHEIKNWRSAGATACFNLKAKYRFALSGTPIQNDANEMFTYLHFIQEPYSDTFANFKSHFGDPKSVDAQQRLSVLTHLYMYRRTFADRILGRPLIVLPEIKTELRFVELSREEIVIYRVVEEVYRKQINPMLSDKTKKGSYTLMLSKLLRLRQAASHPFLLESVFRETFTPDDLRFLERKFKKYEATTLPVYRQIKQWLAPNGEEEIAQPFGKGAHGTDFKMGPFLKNLKPAHVVEKKCHICQDIAIDAQVLDCGHYFCEGCIEEDFQSQINDDGRYYCPKCNKQVGMYKPNVDPNGADDHGQPGVKNQNFAAWKPHVKESQWLELCTKGKAKLVPSAKTIGLKAQMLKWFNEAPNDKILVFTQFRAMARIIGLICEEEKWGHIYLMGEMSWKNREYAVKAFHDNKEVKVMIAILKCGGVGLNLTCANRCINIDPWWNHSVEQQAIGRIFRYGQPKACRVIRLIAKNTVDHRMLDLQKEKIEAIDMAMQTGKVVERLTVEEIASLFGRITRNEKGVPQVESDHDVSDEIFAPASAPSTTPPPG